MKALTNSLTDNDLGMLVFVTTTAVTPIIGGVNVADPDFYPTNGSYPVNNYDVYGLWYLSKAKTCVYNSNMALCWKYIVNTSNGNLLNSAGYSLQIANQGCVNPQ